ncbi:MAG: NifU family protein [Nocardioidaceae bacterium]
MEPADDAREGQDWRAAGEQIEALIDASSAGGAMARERAESLVRLLSDLYGSGLRRLLDILDASGRLDDTLQKAIVGDELIASLLLIHGLHPHDVRTRVEAALDSVRPYLGSHGGDVELLDVSEDRVVTLRLLGSCDGCASSAATLELAVEDAIMAAAPEVVSLEVESADPVPGGGSTSLISVDSLRARLGQAPPDDATWLGVPELESLVDGEIAGFLVGGQSVVACRVGHDLYVYGDVCASCHQGLAGATLQRQLGSADKTVVLTCPQCGAHFDARRAGAGLDGNDSHLQPLPLVHRDGVPTVAVTVGSSA